MTSIRSSIRSGATLILTALLAACSASGQTATGTQPAPVERVVSNTEDAIVSAVAKADPAVVSVIVSKDLPKLERVYEEVPLGDAYGMPDNPFYRGFSLRVPRVQQNGTEKREVGGGTAFFVSSDGLLMTNRHVVEDLEADYTVLLNDGSRLPATVVARDEINDIALLKVEGRTFPSLAIAGADAKLGQTAIAIGNALGEFRNTVSVGIVSGLQRSIVAGGAREPEQLDEILQTDAAINQGNSGGPLLNISGEVIGMNTAVSAVGQNIGFALPSPELRRALSSYQKYGRIVRTYIGVRLTSVTPENRESLKTTYEYGAVVMPGESNDEPAIVPGSPADRAGIKEGDVILEADGERLTPTVSLARIVQQKSPGDTVTLKVARDRQELTIQVSVEERKN